MAVRISKLYNMKIYDTIGAYLGNINDIIINLESGEVVRVTLEPLKPSTKENAAKMLKEKSILYKNVVSLKDIMIVSKKMLAQQETEENPKRAATRSSSRSRPRR